MANPQMFVEVVTSGAQASVTVVGHGDNVGDAFGDDEDFVIVLNTAAYTANDGIDDVLVGTPVTPDLAANSAILSNTTASGDILFAVADGSTNSQGLLMLDGSAAAVVLTDSTKLALGTGSDSQIYYDGTDTYWDLRADGSGDLMIALAGSFPAPDPGLVHIWRGTAGSVDSRAEALLTLEDDLDTELQFLTPNNRNAGVFFGDPENNIIGGIQYLHGTDVFQFRSAGYVGVELSGGATPVLALLGTAGSGGDAMLKFDGEDVDYHIGLDDALPNDTLVIGKGSTLGTTPAITINSDLNVGIVGTPQSGRTLALHGTLSATNPMLISVAPGAVTASGGGAIRYLQVAPSDTQVSDGVGINIAATMFLSEGIYELNGSATIQTTATLYIEGAASEGEALSNFSNYAIFVDAGASRFDGAISLGTDHGDDGQQFTSGGDNQACDWTADTSLREHKNIGEQASPQEALKAMLNTPAYHFHYKEKKGTGDSSTEYIGVMADEAPWAMHHKGKIVSSVNSLGYTVLSVQALNAKIEKLEQALGV